MCSKDFIIFKLSNFNSLSASDVNSHHNAVVACSGCSERGENMLQNGILHTLHLS